MSTALTQRTHQIRATRAAHAAADARQYATTPWDDEPDYLGYYERHIDDWLASPDTTDDLAQRLGADADAAAILRRMLTKLDDRICGRLPEGDLIHDMRAAIRGLAERAAIVSWQPLCDDCDYEDRLAADALRQMRRYGEVIE